MTVGPRLAACVVFGIAGALIGIFFPTAVLAPPASASFSNSLSAATTISSATLAAPTKVSASVSCRPSDVLTATWTAASGVTPQNYEIWVTKNGAGPTLQTTVPGSATSASFSIAASTTYTVLVQSTLNLWTSVVSKASKSVRC